MHAKDGAKTALAVKQTFTGCQPKQQSNKIPIYKLTGPFEQQLYRNLSLSLQLSARRGKTEIGRPAKVSMAK